MLKLIRTLAISAIVIITSSFSYAATIQLKDGRTIQGDIVSNSDGVLVVNSNGIEIRLESNQVASVDMTGAPAAPAQPVAQAAPSAPAAAPAPQARAAKVIPAGTQVLVAIRDTINSQNAHAGMRFRAALQANLRVGDDIVAPAGSQVFGEVVDVEKPGRMVGKAKILIQLTSVSVNGDLINIATNIVGYTGESTGKSTLGRTAGAAAIGGLIDGSSGAKTGAKVGIGASILTKGNHIAIQPGQLIEFQTKTNVSVP